MSGMVTFSVEIELGWGFHDFADPSDVEVLSDDGVAEREALKRFLSVLDEFGVPVSFDIVGHLLLSSCDGDHPGPHAPGWFERDPGTDAETHPLFYFPECVDMIREANVNHEICTHSFSHILCDEVEKEVVAWEIERVQNLHDEPVKSFVPPRHRDPPRGVIKQQGIDTVRVPVEENLPSNPVEDFIWTLSRSHPVEEPRQVEEVVETPTSNVMTLTGTHLSRGTSSPHLAFRLIPLRLRQRLQQNFLESGIQQAVAQDSNVHYWTHLYNLAHDAQWVPLRRLFERLEHSDASVKTMKELAE